jgi:hypothetical protein
MLIHHLVAAVQRYILTHPLIHNFNFSVVPRHLLVTKLFREKSKCANPHMTCPFWKFSPFENVTVAVVLCTSVLMVIIIIIIIIFGITARYGPALFEFPDHRIFTRWDCQPHIQPPTWRTRSPYLWPLKTGSPSRTPRQWVSILVALNETHEIRCDCSYPPVTTRRLCGWYALRISARLSAAMRGFSWFPIF